jgi:hypothetical protein
LPPSAASRSHGADRHGADHGNYTLYHDYGGEAIESEFPRTALSLKLRFFRKCLRKIPELAEARERGVELADEVERLSDERHWLIHGAATAWTDDSVMRLIRRSKSDPHGVEIVTLADIKMLLDQSHSLSIGLAAFVLVQRSWQSARTRNANAVISPTHLRRNRQP